ncbi:bifunctional riboflavin kinase/FAD synthetase [Alphaproteobacteria bacterium]|nr:bifunctional riboflavin kinase/FAD synthetase [Alphaproteobacteria bacterium]
MKYLSNSFDQINIDEKLCLTIGNFDGIHKGHREIIKNLIQQTKKSNLKSAILSFTPHPKIYFNKQKNFMINSQSKKKEILKDLGLDYLIDLNFNDKFTQLSHNEFEDKILLEKLNSKRILIGKDFQYGNQRKGNIDTLKIFCEKNKIELEEIGLILNDHNSNKISSSAIRENLKSGKFELANKDLERNFSVAGKVIKGDQRGRTIGIPTANLEYPLNTITIPYGVYAVETLIEGNTYFGIVNFGIRPTFNKDKPIVEAYLFDFDNDIYGKNIEILFHKQIRQEKKFNDIKELLNQINIDIAEAKKILKYGN